MKSEIRERFAVQTPVGFAKLWMVLLLGSLSAFAPLTIDMYLPALPALAHDFGSSTSLAQMSLTACMFGISFGQLLIGPLSDLWGRRTPLLLGLVVYAAASVVCVMAPSMESFIVLRFVQGLGGAAGIVISRAVVRDMYSGSEMTRFSAMLALVNGVAPVLAPIVGGQLLQVTSWRGVFIVLCAIGVLMFLGVLLGLRETLTPNNRIKGGVTSTFRAFGSLFRDRVFMGYALSQGFVMGAMFAYISGSPFVLQEIYGVSPQTFSVIFAINGVGIILTSQIAGRLAGRVSETKLLMYGLGQACIAGIILFITIILDLGLFGILIPLFFVVSSVGIVSTASFTLAMANQGKSAGSASALIGLMSTIFGGFMAPLVGIAGSKTAVPMGTIIVVLGLLAVLCYVVMVRGARSTVTSK